MAAIRKGAQARAKRASVKGIGGVGRRRITVALRAVLMASVALAGWAIITPMARAGQPHQYIVQDNKVYKVYASFDTSETAEDYQVIGTMISGTVLQILDITTAKGGTTYVVVARVRQIPLSDYYSPNANDPQTTLQPFSGAYSNADIIGEALNTDGTVLVGAADHGAAPGGTYSSYHAFRWTAAGGMVDIDGRNSNTTTSYAYGVSDDGNVVVGTDMSAPGLASGNSAFRWTQASGTMTDLGTISSSGSSDAYGVSGDGNVVVGASSVSASNSAIRHAFSWTATGGFTDLGALGGFPSYDSAYDNSTAFDASEDGSTIVGWSNYYDQATQYPGFLHAVRWTNGTIHDLGVLPGDSQSIAEAVSADGSVIVGTSSSGILVGTYPKGRQPPANGLSGDHAFRWTAATGTADLKTLLSNAGLNMTGISLLTADGLSKDGVAIVGQAFMPGSSTPTSYLATYIDGTNYDVANKEGLVDAINTALASGGGGGFTTTSSVSVSMGELGADQQALFNEEKTLNSLLGGTFDPLLGGGNHIGLTAAAGSTTVAIHGSGQVNDHFTLFGGIGYGNRDYSHATIESPVTVAGGLRWFPDVMGAARPFAEVGGFVSPAQNDTFERVYANGTGTATGTGFTHSTLAEAYIKGGVVLTPTKKTQLALSADIGEGVFSYDGYSEAATSGNPFPATFSGATNTATLVHGEAKLNWTVNDHVKLGLNAGVGHSIGHANVSGTVSGSPYSGSGGDISWIDYGADVAFHLNRRTSLDAFVIGESGDQGTGNHLQAGVDLRAVF